MTKKYAIAFFASMIVLVGLLVGYGIYVNVTSGAHVTKMTAEQYFRVGGATASFREIAPTVILPMANVYSDTMLDVNFQIDGTLTKLYVKAGDRVRAGQVLGEIDNNELPAQIVQAEGKIKSAEAGVIKWEGTAKRYQTLAEVNAVSRQQLDDALESLQAARGELTAARAYCDQLTARQGGGQVIAPHDGDVLRLYQPQGAVVRAGDALVMVGDISSLFVRHNAASTVLAQLAGQLRLAVRKNDAAEKAYATSLAANDAGNGTDFDVRIDEIVPTPDIPAEYRTIVYRISNPAGLLEPGIYYRLKIYGTTKRRVLSVPAVAVRGDAESFVFVVGPDNHLEKRKITTGIRDDDYVEVKAGLQENEVVVVSGQDDDMKPGMKVQVTRGAEGTP